MHYERPVVLSIAGFDPCAGAGVLADIKTLEQQNCLGMAVLTANTVQTEDLFVSVTWYSIAEITAQLAPLFDRYEIAVVKIGIIEDHLVLQALVRWLKEKKAALKIIWDPVIAASAGFKLSKAVDAIILQDILQAVYLVTPNVPEARLLTGREHEEEAATWLSRYSNVLLKGGHAADNLGMDHLYTGKAKISFPPGNKMYYPKHGSGCILSAAIAAGLAKGDTLEQACRTGKNYIEQTLGSNPYLLAYHHV
jgi:hydroxymethylpyrimidine/phosphomethylpyrimidine kinase